MADLVRNAKASPAQILEDLNIVAVSSSRMRMGIAWAPATGGKESGASKSLGTNLSPLIAGIKLK